MVGSLWLTAKLSALSSCDSYFAVSKSLYRYSIFKFRQLPKDMNSDVSSRVYTSE